MTRILISRSTLLLAAISTIHADAGKPNVLPIVSENLRDTAGCEGNAPTILGLSKLLDEIWKFETSAMT